ncbi:helix-turn-helix transcriptional regulator [Enterococcus faecium]|uniref:helix-turn-helix transcriptional regulator n=1 Tax=Enterococcus faecium TaxID=1352 RepID=UPI001C375444|nr:helix-turn-helix transcriptional regulator [Enterococcus faecium]MDT6429655.1 helix-turn-helix transcriptional regulator [Enterococcus faecium]MDT6432318.1 helix-turn-helix transcriptional regulator [Enterococcus faecium]MDT6451404.1 helix-turn-helix transcriptional regulator [Enterococcus faecium]MDV4497874.1 helix-turn-helix transcriptional regulator [Enterococcus faecium]
MKWTDVKKDISSISQEDKNLIELTALLASLRKEKKMTQKELAEKVHVSQAQIARVENFSYTPSLKTVTKIADGLNLELTFRDKTTKELVKN